ncbi:MAG: carboxylating nicotinate-nucleotide diphosphorylase [Saprospiraceae bacterium]|nr:carboxylating nicotinate-nucleotide diphosphorylase [Saprospiraceae bacterium]
MKPYHPELLQIHDFIDRCLHEDVQEGDVTTLACIDPDSRSRGELLVKDVGIIAGIELAEAIFRKVDPEAELVLNHRDGDPVHEGDIAFSVKCQTHALLKAERLVLNSMQRMSGIATLTNRFLFEVEDLPVKLLDTRKTTPGIRFLEKWAVGMGGGHNYRFGLYDWFMIKDNHITACGTVTDAIEKVAAYQSSRGLKLNVTVEVKNLMELFEVLDTGKITRIMFDNFELPLLKEGVRLVNKRFETEASGGVNLSTVRKIAMSGVDYISIGALTHSAQALDMSLKIRD